MEKTYIKNQIEKKAQKVIESGWHDLTDFLDPAELDIAELFINKNYRELTPESYGGYDGAERKRLIITPEDTHFEISDYDIVVVEAITQIHQKEITHRDFLGALMGSGIRREKVGDIVLLSQGAAILFDKKMAHFIADNFPMIKNQLFSVSLHNPDTYIFPEAVFTEKVITIPSMRLDTVIQKGFHVSRSDAQKLVLAGKVKVNHLPTEKTDFIVAESSVISVRTKGRMAFDKVLGNTKKDNIRVLVKIY